MRRFARSPAVLVPLIAAVAFVLAGAAAAVVGPQEGGEVDRRAAREKTFQELLNGAKLAGKWRLVTDGALGEEKAETYTLGEVKKIDGDRWLIQARIQFGDKDLSVPVTVDVFWAGDTPVMAANADLTLFGLGKYRARIMFYERLYAGTWFASDHGGLMSGVVIKDERPAAAPRDPATGDRP
jgi:hypothetical protein